MTEDELAALSRLAEAEQTAPLEEGELVALAGLAGRTLVDPGTDAPHTIGAWDTLRLIAEVRRLRDQLVIERAKHNRAWANECPVTPADLYPEDLAEAREELRAEGFLSLA